MRLTFKRECDEWGDITYVARPALPTVAAYEIEKIPNYGNSTVWQISIKRQMQHLMTAKHAHNFVADIRFTAAEFRTLREARQACEQHADTQTMEVTA